jgi:hypothetical protein
VKKCVIVELRVNPDVPTGMMTPTVKTGEGIRIADRPISNGTLEVVCLAGLYVSQLG